MNHREFIEIIAPLQARHPLHFTGDVCAEIYRIIGHLTLQQGKEIIGKLMLHSRFAPTDKEFREAVSEIFRPKYFVKPEVHRTENIFSEEERKEIWQFVKDVAAGVHSKETIKAYTEVLNATIALHKRR